MNNLEGMLAILIPSGILILGGLLKISRQAGRIEEGVKSLHDRVTRLENREETRDRMRPRR